MTEIEQSYYNWILTSSDDEMKEFFSYFDLKYWKVNSENDISDEMDTNIAAMFWIINYVLSKMENYVYKFFYYRNLIINNDKSTDDIIIVLKEIVSKNEKAWNDYKNGNDKAVGRFVGQLSKLTSISPQESIKIIETYKKGTK
jgi:hypothetical protein